MNKFITITPAITGERDEIIRLLQSAKLPVQDLPSQLDNFFVAHDENTVIGAIGLERYGEHRLLRSLIVEPAYRNRQVAGGLVKQVENMAKQMGLATVYLLTETAGDYFLRKGYEPIERSEAPEILKQSSEYSHVCPSSAKMMCKRI